MAAVCLLVVVALAFVASTQANVICGVLDGNAKYKMLPLGAVQPGDEITVIGTIDNNANRVFINLYQGQSPVWEHSDVSYHYRIDFPLNYIIHNTYTVSQGKWGPEETSSLRTGRGQRLTTTIKITETGYDIIINGAFAYHYRHRQNVRSVGTLYLYGDWTIERIEYHCSGTSMAVFYRDNSYEYLEGYGYGNCPAGYEWFNEISSNWRV